MDFIIKLYIREYHLDEFENTFIIFWEICLHFIDWINLTEYVNLIFGYKAIILEAKFQIDSENPINYNNVNERKKDK